MRQRAPYAPSSTMLRHEVHAPQQVGGSVTRRRWSDLWHRLPATRIGWELRLNGVLRSTCSAGPMPIIPFGRIMAPLGQALWTAEVGYSPTSYGMPGPHLAFFSQLLDTKSF